MHCALGHCLFPAVAALTIFPVLNQKAAAQLAVQGPHCVAGRQRWQINKLHLAAHVPPNGSFTYAADTFAVFDLTLHQMIDPQLFDCGPSLFGTHRSDPTNIDLCLLNPCEQVGEPKDGFYFCRTAGVL